MRTVKVLICEVAKIQIPDELYQEGQDPETDNWQDAINEIGRRIGYDLDPEEGGEWATPLCNLPEEVPIGGVIAIINEQNEIMARA